jgi:Glycosyl hydrolases family 43
MRLYRLKLSRHAYAWLLAVLFFSGLSTAPAAATKPDDVYLFTSFHDADQKFLRFLYSDDGYQWTNVPGTFLEAHVGASKQFRDPSLSRGPDGTFHLVWTAGWHHEQGFGCANSRDLIHWSDQQFIPVMTNEPATVNVWAPELFYDAVGKQYLITWASTIPGRFPDYLEKHDNNHRLYYTTTRDFQHFAPVKLLFDPGFSVIDPFILKDGKRYVLICKDNSRPNLNLRVAFAKTPFGPWEDVSAPLTQKFTEGPCALKIGGDWLIYFDAYRQKIYGAVKTHDFKTFTDATSEVSFPVGHKHGTALRIPRDILEGLLNANH